ncbi:MAG: DUF1800 domain-containing protein [Acidimicrobiales bacterium]
MGIPLGTTLEPDRATIASTRHRDFTNADVAHLLRRAGFASSPAEVDALGAKASWAAVVDAVLDTSDNPTDHVPAMVSDPNARRRAAWVTAVHHWMDRMIATPTPVVEKVTLFWHGILTSAVPKPPPRLVYQQIQTWRRLGLGDIHDLMQAMAVDPAMLVYLDNGTNVAAEPNENFARESMELFTMGNHTFSEDDVVSVARAWTGHNFARRTESYQFRPGRHDDGQKTLFGKTRNWDGPAVLTEIVRGSKQRVCARYLAGRIWSAFAYPDPSAALLDSLAASLVDGSMDVKRFLAVVFNRPEFRKASTRTALVRSPIEWQVAALRSAGLTAMEMRPERWMAPLGQVLFQPPNVSGWRQNRAWISSSAQWAKADFATMLAQRVEAKGNFADLADRASYEVVAAVLDRFGVDDPSPVVRHELEAYALAEARAGRRATLPSNLVGLVLLTPDFQLA